MRIDIKQLPFPVNVYVEHRRSENIVYTTQKRRFRSKSSSMIHIK